MPCCGQRRAALKATGSRLRLGAPGSTPPSSAPEPSRPEVRLAYLANAAIRVRGASTRRTYEFSSTEPVQLVDARDAAGLLRIGLFRTV
jgi:hypothetical protein